MHSDQHESLDSYFNSTAHGTTSSPNSFPCMQLEWLRLQSFSNFPQTALQSPMRLAQAGFFYTGVEDTVQCFSCGVQYSGLGSGDNAIEFHQRISPECRFVHGGDRNNVPIIYTEESVEMVNPRNEGVEMVNPRNEDVEVVNPRNENTNANVERAEPSDTRNNERGHVRRAYNDRVPPQGHLMNSPQGAELNQLNIPNTTARQRQNGPPGSTNSGSWSNQHYRSKSKTSEFKLDSLGIHFGKPKYPAYAVFSVRLSTFQDWPSRITQTPRDLTSAGFLYAGYSDYVRCFFCGGGLRNWDVDEDPWIEHAKWFPRCEFLRQNKGDDFVLEIQQSDTYQAKDAEHSLSVNSPSKVCTTMNDETETPVTSLPAVESVLEMGYSKQMIEIAYGKLTTFKDAREITAGDLLDQIFMLEDGSNQTSLRSKVNNDDNEKEELKIKQDVHSLKEENEKLKQQWQCKICMDKDVCIVFLPCGHMCCCPECAPAMRKCPICRTFVKGTVKSFAS